MNLTSFQIVIGSNDTVNSAAEDDPNSELYGMPVVRVWNAERVFVLKRSLAAGYSGAENPLFYKENTDMLLGDAKESVLDLASKVKGSYE